VLFPYDNAEWTKYRILIDHLEIFNDDHVSTTGRSIPREKEVIIIFSA